MRGLFLKIFGILWLAQSLVFIITTTLIVRQRFPSPNTLSDALNSNLWYNGDAAFRAFLAGGCRSFVDNATRHEPSGATLLDAQGVIVCRTDGAPALSGLDVHFDDRIVGQQLDGRYIWLVPLRSSAGQRYEYVWFQPLSSWMPRTGALLHFAFPQLPVAIAVGGLTTFVLVLLFSRPLIRLRTAARELANGNLSIRVAESPQSKSRLQSDEFQGLIRDFNYMAERLESLVAAQKMLLRDVSHELRSPLSRLSLALELARDDAPPKRKNHLDRIEREIDKLNLLIGQLLTLSSMETTEDSRRFAPVSLNELCQEIVADAGYESQQRHCTVSLQEETEVMVSGDRDLLYRAIENIVRNAIRYTERGTEVALHLTTSVEEQSATITISDHGPGIPESHLADIFRPFYRLDHARSLSTGGFGVGLAIAERAVRLHRGTLQAENRQGGGTSIRIKFPTMSQPLRIPDLP